MKTINRNIALGTGLMGLGLALSVAVPASAAPRHNNDVRQERREVERAQNRVRAERRDVNRARTPAQRREEAQELAEARRRLLREQQDLQREQRERRRYNNNQGRPPYGNAYGYHRNRPTNRPTYRPNYNRPTYGRPGYTNRPTYSNGQRIEFPGRVLNNVNGGSSFQVRADNGVTYTVRVPRGVRLNRGQRVRVTGEWRNGIVTNAGVNFI